MSKIMEEISKDIAVRTAIRTYRECNIDDADIIKRIMERFEITNEVAVEYVYEKCLA